MESWHDDSSRRWVWSTHTAPGVTGAGPRFDPIECATDDVLILELVKRGYAVAKMPPEQLAEASK